MRQSKPATAAADQATVIYACDKEPRGVLKSFPTDGGLEPWSLSLTAISADEPERLVRYLTGALLACGGWVLTRSTQGGHIAELDFEFARASCVEIYAVLVATGLELSRASHLQLAELCHCTRNLIESRAFDIARADLVVYHSSLRETRDEYTPALAG